MGKFSYIIKRLGTMHYDVMWKVAGQIAHEKHSSRVRILVDMVKCGTKYGAGYMDYLTADFFDLTDAQRATHITRGINNQIVAKYNKKEFWNVFDNKFEFDQKFGKYIERGYFLYDPEDPSSMTGLAEWLNGRGKVIAKPISGTHGDNIQKFNAEANSVVEIAEKVGGIGKILFEDYIVQHSEMSRLYPHSVNTIRVVTIHGDKKSGILYACVRVGAEGRIIDNLNGGGFTSPVDLETGKIIGPGVNKKREVAVLHPDTGVEFAGFQIPHWEMITKMCMEAAEIVPEIAYTGWDVAVTENGAEIIEGNSYPGHDIVQFHAHFPDGIGIMPRVREFTDL